MATKQELLKRLRDIQQTWYDFGQDLIADPEPFDEPTSTAYVGGYVGMIGLMFKEIATTIETLK